MNSRSLHWIFLILTFFFYLAAFLNCLRPLQDPDLWWHLASGREIIRLGGIPSTDVFSWTAAGTAWINTYWLYDVLVYGVERLTGISGVLLMHAALVVSAMAMIHGVLKQRHIPWPAQLLTLMTLFITAAPSGGFWGAQSSLISLFFFAAFLLILDRPSWLTEPKLIGILMVLLVIWVNLHRGFLLGLLLLGFACLEQVRADRRRWGRATAVLLVATAATIINPFGIELYRMIQDDLRLSSQLIAGWTPGTWKATPQVFLTAALYSLLLIVRGWKKTGAISFLSLLTLLLALASYKAIVFIPYFLIMAWVDIATGVVQGLRGEPWRNRLSSPAVMGVSIAGITAALVFLLSRAAPALGVQAASFPTDLPFFMEREKLKGTLFNDYRLGGYVMWFRDQMPAVFIDGRYPGVQGYQPLILEIVEAMKNPRDWKRFLDDKQITMVLMEYRSLNTRPTFLESMFPASAWALVYWDETAALYVRRTATYQPVIQRHGFSLVKPDDSPFSFRSRIKDFSPAQKKQMEQELVRAGETHPRSRRIQAMLRTMRHIQTQTLPQEKRSHVE